MKGNLLFTVYTQYLSTQERRWPPELGNLMSGAGVQRQYLRMEQRQNVRMEQRQNMEQRHWDVLLLNVICTRDYVCMYSVV